MKPKTRPTPPCPNEAQHTKQPGNYLGWHAWADEMARTHTQKRCSGCGLWKIWVRRPDAPDLPPIEYRLDHLSCACCEGDPDCDCQYH